MSIILCSACSIDTAKPSIPIMPDEIVLQHLHYLSSDSLAGRQVGTKGGLLAQDYIIKQLQQYQVMPLTTAYKASFSSNNFFKTTQGNNIVGFTPGTIWPNKFIVLSAHFDHLGSRGRKIYHGADDNASGTSALLHYAKRIQQSPLRHSVIFLFTDGEEANLMGARAFIKQNSHLLADIALNINIDMIAGTRSTKKLRYISRRLDEILTRDVIQTLTTQDYAIELKQGFKQHGRSKKPRIRWEIASDHAVFYQQKIPFIYYGVGNHQNYHQTSDSYENINQQFFLAAVATIYQQISFIDQNL
tara:strand:- start:23805 stop:24710 length:906 start_codon:yes stop_codon:yes gene_type:complete